MSQIKKPSVSLRRRRRRSFKATCFRSRTATMKFPHFPGTLSLSVSVSVSVSVSDLSLLFAIFFSLSLSLSFFFFSPFLFSVRFGSVLIMEGKENDGARDRF